MSDQGVPQRTAPAPAVRPRTSLERSFGLDGDPVDEPSDAVTPDRPPDNRSRTERSFRRVAGTDGAEGHLSESAERNRSLAERISPRSAETGDDDAHPSGSATENRSLTEAFPAAAAEAEADAGSGADPADDGWENRSLAEPSSDDPPPAAPNPWHRAPDHDDREQRADDIAYLVARWEMGTVHRLHALARHHDLDLREFLVLSELAVRPAGLTASQLCGVVGGGPARMSVLVRGLEERGLLERDPDPWDRRSILIGVSDRAREFLPHRPAPRLRRYVRQEFSSEVRAGTVRHFVAVAASLSYDNARDLREGPGLA